MGNCNCIGGASVHETRYTHQQEEITQNQSVDQNHPVYSETVAPALQRLNTINHVIGLMEPLFRTSEGREPFESEEFKDIRYDALQLRTTSRHLRRNVQNRVNAVNSGRIHIEQMSNNTQHAQDLFHLDRYVSQFIELRRRYNSEINRTASSVNEIPPTASSVNEIPPFERTDSNEIPPFERTDSNEIPPFERTDSNEIPPFERTDSDVRNFGIQTFYARPLGR